MQARAAAVPVGYPRSCRGSPPVEMLPAEVECLVSVILEVAHDVRVSESLRLLPVALRPAFPVPLDDYLLRGRPDVTRIRRPPKSV